MNMKGGSNFQTGSNIMMLVAFLLVVVLPSASADECAEAPASWIFCSGFEEGDLSIWDDYDGNPASTNRLVSDPGPFGRDDNHVAQIIVPPGRGGADLVKVLPGQHQRLYARWYIKWEPGFSFATQGHVGAGLHGGARSHLGRSSYRPSGDDWFSGWFESNSAGQPTVYTYYRGMYMDCMDPNGSCWGDSFPCYMDEGERYCTRPEHRPMELPAYLQVDNWHCVELMMDAGQPSEFAVNASGRMGLWVDEAMVGSWDRLWFRTAPNVNISVLWLNVFFHGSHGSAGVRYDNVAVSTERIGCGMRIAPPRPPHGVLVD